jgi:DNA helicase IV
VDYLIQQFPDIYDAKNIAIITPNRLLEEYLVHSLDQSVFSFKDEVKTFHRASRSHRDMPNNTISDKQRETLLTDKLTTGQSIQNKRQQQYQSVTKAIDT